MIVVILGYLAVIFLFISFFSILILYQLGKWLNVPNVSLKSSLGLFVSGLIIHVVINSVLGQLWLQILSLDNLDQSQLTEIFSYIFLSFILFKLIVSCVVLAYLVKCIFKSNFVKSLLLVVFYKIIFLFIGLIIFLPNGDYDSFYYFMSSIL